MTAVNLFKNQKSKHPQKNDSDKEWTPTIENSDSVMKKSQFHRIWSEEDEISILEGYLNYSSLYNVNPSSDYDAFLAFVKDKLQEETNKTQLQDKLTRLKKKYKKNVDNKSFSKPHEEKLFKLSERIWGSQADQVHKNSIGMCSDLILGGGTAADLENWFRKNPRKLISEKDRKEMLEKSQSVKIGKAQQYLLEIQVMEEQTKLVIDALEDIHP